MSFLNRLREAVFNPEHHHTFRNSNGDNSDVFLMVRVIDLKALLTLLDDVHFIKERITIMAGELDTLTTAVAQEITVEQSAIVLLGGLKASLDAAGTDPAKLAALSKQIGDSSGALAAAVAANTPAAPTPTPAPTTADTTSAGSAPTA